MPATILTRPERALIRCRSPPPHPPDRGGGEVAGVRESGAQHQRPVGDPAGAVVDVEGDRGGTRRGLRRGRAGAAGEDGGDRGVGEGDVWLPVPGVQYLRDGSTAAVGTCMGGGAVPLWPKLIQIRVRGFSAAPVIVVASSARETGHALVKACIR